MTEVTRVTGLVTDEDDRGDEGYTWGGGNERRGQREWRDKEGGEGTEVDGGNEGGEVEGVDEGDGFDWDDRGDTDEKGESGESVESGE